MRSAPTRGEIWRLRLISPDKRCPVLILSRPALIEALHTVTVAAITSTLRGSPTEVPLGAEQGLKRPSCVNLAHLFTVEQASLRNYVGTLDEAGMERVRRALAIATGCDS